MATDCGGARGSGVSWRAGAGLFLRVANRRVRRRPASSTPYAATPEDLRPFSKFSKPYYENYTKTPEYNGAAADTPTVPAPDIDEVAIGFLGPVREHKDMALGLAMLHGAQLAIDEANARGGYCGKPFRAEDPQRRRNVGGLEQ